jgi:hypothetical protein
MHKHISIRLLKTLNDKELKKLKDYICSPYFNKSDTLIKLFEMIIKHAPSYISTKLQKEKLYKKLYPGKSYNEQTIRSRMVELAALVRGYIALCGTEKNNFVQKKSLIKEFRARQLFDLSEKILKKSFERLEKNGVYDTNYFRDCGDLLDQLSKLYISRDMKPESFKLSYKRGEFMLNCFLNNLLQINDEIIKSSIELKEKPEVEYVKLFFEKFDFPSFLKTLESMNYKYYPFLAINYYTTASLSNPEDERNFYKLKELIFAHYKNFTLSEIYNYWSMLSNAVFVNYLTKGKKFLAEGHEINKFFIEKKLYDESKPLSAMAYQNTVINALLVKDISWADEFIESFKDKLTLEARDNRYNFCRAMLLFDKEQYEDSLSYLGRVRHADWHFKIGIRMYYLKNYYELGWHEQLISMLDSFKHFASDNKSLPEYIDDRIKNSLYYIGKLASAKFDGKKLDYADFKEAEESKAFTHKEWIIEKMQELL